MATISTTVDSGWHGVEVRWYLDTEPPRHIATATKAEMWVAEDAPVHVPVMVRLTHQSLAAGGKSARRIAGMATAKWEDGRLVGRARFA